MRAVIQRVNSASVSIEGKIYSSTEKGLMVLLGVGENDSEKDALKTAEKIANMRIFSNNAGKFDLSVKDIGGEILLVSQFTLYGDASKGRRPDFSRAARPVEAEKLYKLTASALEKEGLKVKTGIFQAEMKVSLENDGPVTVIYET
ncbi:MAG: D-aminoacyl-tRNA deacylase [Elusimicrobiota bacterium]